MVLSLVKLIHAEHEAIGQSIIGLENPDLSMFPVGERDMILVASIKYLVGLLNNHAPAATIRKIKTVFPMFTLSYMKNIAELNIKRAAEGMAII